MLKHIVLAISVLALFTGCVKMPGMPKSQATLYKNKVYKSDKDVLMFIMDASGSMTKKDKRGQIKLVGAKNTLKDIISKVDPKKTNVGLIGFEGGCESTKLYIEPSNNDLDLVIDRTNKIKAYSRTPLADSIRTAGEVLKNIDKKIRLIIISDGKESCFGDPVAEAQKLKSVYGIDAEIHIVGYSVDRKTRGQLVRVARAGGGQYYNAGDSIALGNIVSNITDKLDIKSDNWDGDTYKFKINFKSGSSKLQAKYDEQVKDFASYLKRTGYGAELQGHTDSHGDLKSNQVLSKKRAQSVVDRLVSYDVDESKIYSVGYGELAPIKTNDTKEGRFENRRVEAHLIKDGKMDISYINRANNSKVVDVKNANESSFIGYYKVLDTKRSYEEYHMWMELYSNLQGSYSDYIDYKDMIAYDKEDLGWTFNKSKRKIVLDYSNNGRKPGWAKFEGQITGNTNKFYLTGVWGDGNPGKIVMTRISKEELECMKREERNCAQRFSLNK